MVESVGPSSNVRKISFVSKTHVRDCEGSVVCMGKMRAADNRKSVAIFLMKTVCVFDFFIFMLC